MYPQHTTFMLLNLNTTYLLKPISLTFQPLKYMVPHSHEHSFNFREVYCCYGVVPDALQTFLNTPTLVFCERSPFLFEAPIVKRCIFPEPIAPLKILNGEGCSIRLERKVSVFVWQYLQACGVICTKRDTSVRKTHGSDFPLFCA